MPKPFLPPQGGEKWLCLGMFLTLMMSVIMIVVVIYCIVIIYDPSVKEIYSEINPEPKRCSTTFVERNITGTPEDQKCNWSSCEEWCLSKGASPCSKVSPMFISDLNMTNSVKDSDSLPPPSHLPHHADRCKVPAPPRA